MRVPILAAAALVLLLVGFTMGWTLAKQNGWTLADNESPETMRPARPETPPPTTETAVPAKEVAGRDIRRLPRYPGSARTQYTREDLENVTWTEVEYVTSAELDPVREFYRDVFRTEGWSVGDVSFSEGAWNFLVIQGEREVYIELESRDEIVEIDFEMTVPKPEREDKPEERPSKPKNPRPAPPRQTPTAQPAPVQPATPAYEPDDDGGEEYDDYEAGED